MWLFLLSLAVGLWWKTLECLHFPALFCLIAVIVATQHTLYTLPGYRGDCGDCGDVPCVLENKVPSVPHSAVLLSRGVTTQASIWEYLHVDRVDIYTYHSQHVDRIDIYICLVE